MNEHTPGPWAVGRNLLHPHQENSVWTIGRKLDIVIARMSRNFSEAETGANVRLIAAAPDLLAACKLWLKAEALAEKVIMLDWDGLEEVQLAREQAKDATLAAMAKAKGES